MCLYHKLVLEACVQVDLCDFMLLEFAEARPSIDTIKELLLFSRNLNIW